MDISVLMQTIENIPLPFHVPTLLHPAVVHFAIAIPVIALLLEVLNLALRRRCIGVISGMLLLLAAVVYMAAFITGKVDGKEAYALLSTEGKEELAEHKELGAYLLLGIWGVVTAKLIFMMIRRFWAKALFVLILAGFVAAAFKQGKDGGELVYEYGANVEAVTKMDDKVMELEEKIGVLKEETSAKESESKKADNATAEDHKNEVNESEQKSEIEQKASEALEQLKGKAGDEAAKTEEGVEEIKEAANKAAQEVKEAAEAAKDEAEHKADEAVDAAKEAATDTLNQTQKQTTLPAAH
jgi:uncharacterized membrane protein